MTPPGPFLVLCGTTPLPRSQRPTEFLASGPPKNADFRAFSPITRKITELRALARGRGPGKRKEIERVAELRSSVEPRLKSLRARIVEFDALAEKAASSKHYTASVQARARAVALQREVDQIEAEVWVESASTPIDRLGRLRRLAAQDGSWVAASTLAKEEADAVRRRDEAVPPPVDPISTLTTEEVVDALAQAIGDLPDLDRAKLLSLLGG